MDAYEMRIEEIQVQAMFRSLNIDNCDLPFDWAQGGEPVEPFVIWCLGFVILLSFKTV